MAAMQPVTNGRPFAWPHGKRAAVSLSFDDARASQIDRGMAILDRHGVRATFYVTLRAMDLRLEGWKTAVARGHEIGNHTVSHPCSGNFSWSRGQALEDFSLARMEGELTEANRQIQNRLGVEPVTFAYPCGQQFVGRGVDLQSYVPLVASHFLAGRGFRDEFINAPSFCDMSKLGAFQFDATGMENLKALFDAAVREEGWVILAGHEVGNKGDQTVRADVLDEICRYCLDPAQGIWLDTVAAVARYVSAERSQGQR